jgi:hypothetical protein
VALFCDAHDAGGGGVASSLGMPGATRWVRETKVTATCADGVTVYVPDVGGCP